MKVYKSRDMKFGTGTDPLELSKHFAENYNRRFRAIKLAYYYSLDLAHFKTMISRQEMIVGLLHPPSHIIHVVN